MKKQNEQGFTLIELLVVIAVIAILAAILVPAVTKVITDAKWTEMKSNGKNLYTSVYADAIDANVIGFPNGNAAGAPPNPSGGNGTSTSLYFKELASAGTANPAGTGTKILAATPDFVSGPKRVDAVQWSALIDANVAWQAAYRQTGQTTTFSESTDAGTPFLVSCNWAGATIAADTSTAGTQIVNSNIDNSGTGELSAGDKKVCVAQHGGGSAVFAVQAKDNIADINPTGLAIDLLAQ